MSDDSIEAVGHNSLVIVNTILYEMDNKLTPLQVNKLTYFSHGWLLGLYGRPLISEQVEAWRYGPVVPAVYYALRENGRSPVRFMDYFDCLYNGLDDKEKDIIKQVIEGYGSLSGSELIGLTHEEGTPWSQCYDKSKQNTVIPNQIIKEYFESKSHE